jgi:hypothetical protein
VNALARLVCDSVGVKVGIMPISSLVMKAASGLASVLFSNSMAKFNEAERLEKEGDNMAASARHALSLINQVLDSNILQGQAIADFHSPMNLTRKL